MPAAMAANARKEVSRRELALLALGACLIAVVMTWPLVLNLRTDISKDLGDPLVQSWEVAWDGYALAHQPLQFFQSNQFWPLHDTLAFSDALAGYAPAGLIGNGPEDAVARYNVLFLFAYALCFAGAYLLGRELGLPPAAAVVCGAAYAFAPLRLEQDGHLHVVSSGGIPLALALGLRGYRLFKPGWVVAGFCVAAWELTLGFTLGLPLAYILLSLGLIAAVWWLQAGRPRPPRRLLIATVVGALIFAATAIVMSRPYMRVLDGQPNARRSIGTVEHFSGPLKVFLIAPPESTIWGDATAGLREGVSNIPEKTLFPGLLTLGLAVAGLCTSAYRRGVRIGLGIGVLLFSALALGFKVEDGLLWPYRIAYEVLPGFQGLRTPGRLVTFSSLGLALLAGAGAEALRRAYVEAARRGRLPGGAGAASALIALLAVGVTIEGRGLPFDPLDDQAQPAVPRADIRFASIPAPQLHLPALRPPDNRRYLLWSTDGFPAIVNGRSSIDPVFIFSIFYRVEGFPDPASVALLRETGVRSVVLHTDRTANTPWAYAAPKPIAGLGITRRRRGYDLVYELGSPSAVAGTGEATAAAAAGFRRSR